MDPNATLTRLRELASDISTGEYELTDQGLAAAEMAELFDGLDTWLSRRGFLPTEWQR